MAITVVNALQTLGQSFQSWELKACVHIPIHMSKKWLMQICDQTKTAAE